MAKQRYIQFGERVKKLRQELGLSQEALGSQGFVSTPGWIKIENSQRQASEKLIDQLAKWLVQDKHLRAGASNALREELLTLKYLGNRSPFVQAMAEAHAKKLPGAAALLTTEPVAVPKKRAKRGRVAKVKK